MTETLYLCDCQDHARPRNAGFIEIGGMLICCWCRTSAVTEDEALSGKMPVSWRAPVLQEEIELPGGLDCLTLARGIEFEGL